MSYAAWQREWQRERAFWAEVRSCVTRGYASHLQQLLESNPAIKECINAIVPMDISCRMKELADHLMTNNGHVLLHVVLPFFQHLEHLLICAAAQRGNVTALHVLGNLGCLPDARSYHVLHQVLYLGHADVLDYLLQHMPGLAMDATLCARTVRKGHFECLRVLRAHGCPWDSSTQFAAIERDDTVCVEYALSHSCPVNDIEIGREVAACGDLTLLQRVVALGCPIGEVVAAAAARGGHLECMTYVMDHMGPTCHRTPALCHAAAASGSLACLRHVMSAGWPSVLMDAAAAGKLPAVRELHAQGFPLWTRACHHGNGFWFGLCRQWVYHEGQGANPDGPPGGVLYFARLWQARQLKGTCLEGQYDDLRCDPTLHWPGARVRLARRVRDIAYAVTKRSVRMQKRVGNREEAAVVLTRWPQQDFADMAGVLRYGALHGAPLTPEAAMYLRVQRARTRAVLACFHAADRLSCSPHVGVRTGWGRPHMGVHKGGDIPRTGFPGLSASGATRHPCRVPHPTALVAMSAGLRAALRRCAHSPTLPNVSPRAEARTARGGPDKDEAGASGNGRLWVAMAAVPPDLIHSILEVGGMEIQESFLGRKVAGQNI